MRIESASLATATLLNRLLSRLESAGVVSPEFIDELMNDAVCTMQDTGHRANDAAEEFLHEVWKALHEDRNRPIAR